MSTELVGGCCCCCECCAGCCGGCCCCCCSSCCLSFSISTFHFFATLASLAVGPVWRFYRNNVYESAREERIEIRNVQNVIRPNCRDSKDTRWRTSDQKSQARARSCFVHARVGHRAHASDESAMCCKVREYTVTSKSIVPLFVSIHSIHFLENSVSYSSFGLCLCVFFSIYRFIDPIQIDGLAVYDTEIYGPTE